MGARGPKRGHKTLAAAAARKAAAVVAAPPVVETPPKPAPRAAKQPSLAMTREQAAKLSAAHRENPAKLGGEALRHLGSRLGLARSDMARMTDDKVRQQLQLLTHRQYEEEGS